MKQPRWFLLTFTLFILVTLMQAKWKSLHHIMQQERSLQIAIKQALQEQANYSSLTARHHNKKISPHAVFETVMLAMKNGLRIKQWHVLHTQGQALDMKCIELEVTGLFQQQMLFLSQLLQAPGNTLIQTLDWQLEQDQFLRLKIKYAWLPELSAKNYFDHDLFDLNQMRYPFQADVLPYSSLQRHQHDDDLPVSALRFAGRWQEAGKQFALLAWPDHCERVVRPGQQLGLEHAVVAAINRDHVVLTVPDKHQRVLIWL